MIKVILDANALMMPFQFGLNLSAEIERLVGRCEMIVPSSVVSELRNVSEKNKGAKAALKLAERFSSFKTEARGDEAIVEAALAIGALVITNDTTLLRRLKELGIGRIRLRSRTHLVLDGE